ncbi:uncharacterized protein BXZ73DRAFT_101862 [Epithele typhae]|uniref:uncharacterized protein n=1 Tax=Epithele typhae TaxID=378194 RepID=UPI0020081FAC|nr:uncharacterized protein BXZ73DRAFT_101862 [Epithele typhae]KAH9930490.1 hypothetical protein BXZ73DRAFT_101862 [Epithele typhae]
MSNTKSPYNGYPDTRDRASGPSYPHETVLYPPTEPPPSYNDPLAPAARSAPSSHSPAPLNPTNPYVTAPTHSPSPSSSSHAPAPNPTNPNVLPSSSPSASFTRSRNPAMPCGPFEPLTVLCAGPALAAGFPAHLPPSATVPHPFGTHDVAEADWARFLADLAHAGARGGEPALRTAFAPPTPPEQGAGGGFGLGRGFGRGRGGRGGGGLIEQLGQLATQLGTPKDSKKGADSVTEVLREWNNNFFHHRNIDAAVVLDAPPPPPQAASALETPSSAPPSERWVLVLRYWQPGGSYVQQQGYAGAGGFSRT